MVVELIPVVEIGYNNQGVPIPDAYPYWENTESWDTYHAQCHQKAGFPDALNPYLKGSSFYALPNISDKNLAKLIIDHTQSMREGEHQRLQDTCTLFGGFVLRIDGQDKYYPQCCGELSDIAYWEEVSNGLYAYCEGHPTPRIEFDNTHVIFDFSVDEFDEYFQPTPTETTLIVELLALREAVAAAKVQLSAFEKRIELININEKLYIEDIGRLLIWDHRGD